MEGVVAVHAEAAASTVVAAEPAGDIPVAAAAAVVAADW